MLDYNSSKREDGKDYMMEPERYRQVSEEPPEEVQKKMDAMATLAWRAAGTQDATDVEMLKASESDGGLRAVGSTKNLDDGPRP
eukprot:6010121-Pleurochrysis_carterae.AAC.1